MKTTAAHHEEPYDVSYQVGYDPVLLLMAPFPQVQETDITWKAAAKTTAAATKAGKEGKEGRPSGHPSGHSSGRSGAPLARLDFHDWFSSRPSGAKTESAAATAASRNTNRWTGRKVHAGKVAATRLHLAMELAAAGFTFTVLPDVFLVAPYTATRARGGSSGAASFKEDPSSAKAVEGRKRVRAEAVREEAAEWVCMDEKVRSLSARYDGFREREPCWVSSDIWPAVADMYSDECRFDLQKETSEMVEGDDMTDDGVGVAPGVGEGTQTDLATTDAADTLDSPLEEWEEALGIPMDWE